MACIRPNGTLSRAAQAILRLVEDEKPPEALARVLSRPLFAVRANLRELAAAGLVSPSSAGGYLLTSEGQARIGGPKKEELGIKK